MTTILRERKTTCERRCGPQRLELARLPVGVGMAVRGYHAQPCPCCGDTAAWVHGELRCIACGCAHIPDRTHRPELVEVRTGVFATAPCGAWERLPRRRERAGRA